MSAKEMFEKLGYLENRYKDCIEYVLESDIDINVLFKYDYKEITVYQQEYDGVRYCYPISIELFKAIQQQIKELRVVR